MALDRVAAKARCERVRARYAEGANDVAFCQDALTLARDLPAALAEIERLEREAIDDHAAHRAVVADIAARMGAAEAELARVRALVPQVANAAAAWGEERAAELGDDKTATKMEKKLNALLADAARDGRQP